MGLADDILDGIEAEAPASIPPGADAPKGFGLYQDAKKPSTADSILDEIEKEWAIEPKTNILGGAKDIGKLLYDIPVQTKGAIGQMLEEDDPLEKSDWKDRWQEEARQRTEQRAGELTDEQKEERLIPGTDFLTRGDVQDTSQSTGFSLASMGSSLAGAGAAALVPNVPIAGQVAAGMAAGGAAAYKMDKTQVTRQLIDAANKTAIDLRGNPLTDAERKQLLDETDSIRSNHALWEAGPEAVGNALAMTGIGRIFSGVASKATGKIISGIIANMGGELSTETVTQMGQQRAESALGLNGEQPREFTSAEDWKQSFKEVAPQTVILTGLTGGAGAVAGAAKRIVTTNADGTENVEIVPPAEESGSPEYT